MDQPEYDIEIISAPSILGLKPTGVEYLSQSLLDAGLAEIIKCRYPVINVPALNHLYSYQRDAGTNCLNTTAIIHFSRTLADAVRSVIDKKRFAFVLGGDCSLLPGIMYGLRKKGKYGLIFLDAHADFYEPEKSITGEVADMDLAITTGRGPEQMTDIDQLKPYVTDDQVIHIGQRDWEETQRYGSQDIRKTAIHCFDLSTIEERGMNRILQEVLQLMNASSVDGYWIHFDTDVLSDAINPAVDYRLPGGLQFEQVEYLINNLLLTSRMVGISVTIFNPDLDNDKSISKRIVESLGRAFGAAHI